MSTQNTIPERSQISQEDRWNLNALYTDDLGWEKDFRKLDELIPGIGKYKNTLGDTPARLVLALNYFKTLGQLEERLGYYAMLRKEENVGDSAGVGREARFMQISTRLQAEMSYVEPELLSIEDKTISKWMTQDSEVSQFRIYLEKILRFKPHILGEKEETLLAMQAEYGQVMRKTFSALTNVDMQFGSVKTPEGPQPLTQTTYALFTQNPDRSIRKSAYELFFKEFESHQHSLASLYEGSVQKDIYKARIRGYSSARKASLFRDDVEEQVYDNLIGTVSDHLKPLHDYYKFRKDKLGLETLRMYDTRVSLIENVQVNHTYDQAVDSIISALSPLGDEYTDTLKSGLTGGWVDRYENKGKRSGAFSAGSYIGDPYILMNYKENDLRDVFTLAHEGGHSMHSWYSVRNNPFQHYNYTIFEAEVASTFNEQLLFRSMMDTLSVDSENDKAMKAYLTGKQIDDVIATIYRQTMFAEYEFICHDLVEKGTPLTVEALRQEYRKLLVKYFGSEMVLEENSDLEGLRIPHFYSAFYVYKYATGLSAAMALSEMVLKGRVQERDRYLSFLKSGGSGYPLESLKKAGVDMSKPEPVESALKKFKVLVEELKALI